MKRLLPALCLAALPALGQGGLPLPAQAPLRLLIPDPDAFDAALTGAFRDALTGGPLEGDPVARGFRTSRVGAKLEDQWARLRGDLPWTWNEVLVLRPRAVGLALLDPGHLEAVLVVDTPLPDVPVPPAAGRPRTHAGVDYRLVQPGAGDGSDDTERRAGLAWGRVGGLFVAATSERAFRLTVDEAQARRLFAPALSGLVALELDLDALGQDRYFRREFLFFGGRPRAQGRVRAALRLEGGRIVEVREGQGVPEPDAYDFAAPDAAAAGWDPDAGAFWPTLRRSILEPVPLPPDRPLAARAALPSPRADGAEDRYAVDLTKPGIGPRSTPGEEAELPRWRSLLAPDRVAGWGHWISRDGAPRLVIPWPEARDDELAALVAETLRRTAGRAEVVRRGGVREFRVGPALPAVALRRTGRFLWFARDASDLEGVTAPSSRAGLLRWSRVDLGAVRGEAGRWAGAEGPLAPEIVRPLSDRVLGLLGWMPATRSISVERTRTRDGWAERVVFETAGR
jgi:hypothetical protein